MKKRTLLAAIVALLVALLVSLFFNYKHYRDSLDRKESVTVNTTVEHHEAAITSPQATSENVVGTVTVTAAKVTQKPRNEDVPLPKDTTGIYEPPDTGDSVQVTLPITQKVYEDSLYTAYVSGYMPSLDSIRLRYPVITTTVTKTIEKKLSRVHLGLTGGYGYGFRSRQLEPFIGVGVTIDLF